MPVGGICAGNVYLSGEGSLTGWQINTVFLSIRQGFMLRTTAGGKTAVYQLNQRDFPKMTFRGEYPIARIDYPARGAGRDQPGSVLAVCPAVCRRVGITRHDLQLHAEEYVECRG